MSFNLLENIPVTYFNLSHQGDTKLHLKIQKILLIGKKNGET
jgi:hypothetical protein